MKKIFLLSLITFIFCLGYVSAQDIKERSYKEVGDDFLKYYCKHDYKGMQGMLDELNVNNIEYVLWLLEKSEKKLLRGGDAFPYSIVYHCPSKEYTIAILDRFVILLKKIADENDSIDISNDLHRYEVEKSKYILAPMSPADRVSMSHYHLVNHFSAPVYNIFKKVGTRTNPAIVSEADHAAKVEHSKGQLMVLIMFLVLMPPICFFFYRYKDAKFETIIRLEERNDYRETENFVRESYWNVKQPGCTMHFLVNQCRLSTDFIPEMDLVMERVYSRNESSEKEIRTIGHIMFSKANLVLDNGDTKEVLLLVTICIDSKHRKFGNGSQLLNYSLDKAKELGAGLVCVIGDVEFFKSSGFDYAKKNEYTL